MSWITGILYLLTLTWCDSAGKVLSGIWTVSDGVNKNFTVHVKNALDSYSALKMSGLIDDPLIGMHDTDYRWIANRNWTFTHTFRMEEQMRTFIIYELVWNELDTFCRVSLNDVLLDSVNSSFLHRSWFLGGVIRMGAENRLTLQCVSTVQKARQIAESMNSSPPPDCWPDVFRGECHINLVRTTQASFGWDWGPAYPIQGFWEPPRIIRSYRGCRFGTGFRLFTSVSAMNHTDSDQFVTSPKSILWNADASIEVLFTSPLSKVIKKFCISFAIDDLLPNWKTLCYIRYESISSVDVPLVFFTNQSGIMPWWPNGIVTGPRTYRLRLKLTTISGVVLDRVTHTIGFRQFEVVEKPVLPGQSMQGLSFYFHVNGLAVFAKGANWIPSRLLPGGRVGYMQSVDRENADSSSHLLLASAAAAGVNVIRIWGGGRYEPDSFYEEADRLGLMIWHDMMFAVATYAARGHGSNATDIVEQEIRTHIRRLHSHPSIVVWATDNEVKQAINDGWYGPPGDRKLLNDFKDRFVDSIATVIHQEELPKLMDLSLAGAGAKLYRPRRCLISSPSNGRLTEQMKGLDLYPQDPHYGDVHYYTYSGNLWSEKSYPITRFTSEFGIQSLPSPLAWKRSLTAGPVRWTDWDIDGPMMSHRQHHSSGKALFQLAVDHIGPTVNVSDPIRHYSRWAYLTQLNQMMAYRTHINLLMRHQCRLVNPDGTIHTALERTSMGAIYWQLNDVWSAPTWSSLDAAGQWKMVHYGAVRECFQNFPTGRLSAQLVSGEVQIDWIAPTQPKQRIIKPDHVRVRCHSIDSFEPTTEWTQGIHWPSQNTTCPVTVLRDPVDHLVSRCKMTQVPKAHVLIHLQMVRNGNLVRTGSTVLLLDLPAKIDRWPPESGQNGIWVEDLRPGNQKGDSPSWPVPWKASDVFQLRVRSRSPELFVWMELDPNLDVQYWFDENAFHLLQSSGRHVRLFVMADHPLTAMQIRSSLRFHSLSTVRQT